MKVKEIRNELQKIRSDIIGEIIKLIRNFLSRSTIALSIYIGLIKLMNIKMLPIGLITLFTTNIIFWFTSKITLDGIGLIQIGFIIIKILRIYEKIIMENREATDDEKITLLFLHNKSKNKFIKIFGKDIEL